MEIKIIVKRNYKRFNLENLFGTIIIYLYNIHKIQLNITFSHLLKN